MELPGTWWELKYWVKLMSVGGDTKGKGLDIYYFLFQSVYIYNCNCVVLYERERERGNGMQACTHTASSLLLREVVVVVAGCNFHLLLVGVE